MLDSVSIHRERLAELERLLQDIILHPTVLNDEIFEETLATVTSQVEQLWNDAQEAARSGGEAVMDEKNCQKPCEACHLNNSYDYDVLELLYLAFNS